MSTKVVYFRISTNKIILLECIVLNAIRLVYKSSPYLISGSYSGMQLR